MQRRHVYGAVSLVASTLMLFACGDRQSPLQPTSTPTAVAPAFQDFRLSGAVVDTASRPLSDAKVEVTDGPRAATFTMTDSAGRFSMPGTFTGNITIAASKNGYARATRPLHQFGPTPSGAAGGAWEVYFSLAPLGPSVDVSGVYTLTLAADSACPDWPAVARTRTYTARIARNGGSNSFLATLGDGRFFSTVPCPAGRPPETCTYNRFGIGTAGDYANIQMGIVEQLGDAAYLVVSAGTAGLFDPSGISWPLDGELQYCPNEPVLIDQGTWSCQGTAGVLCDSHQHQLTLVRR
jgi:hypothetical protein